MAIKVDGKVVHNKNASKSDKKVKEEKSWKWKKIWFIWKSSSWYPLMKWMVLEDLWDELEVKVTSVSMWDKYFTWKIPTKKVREDLHDDYITD